MNALLGLAIWCGSGAIVGGAIGAWYDRAAAGVLLGTFCGVIGWILVLGAGPRPGTHASRDRARRALAPGAAVVIEAPTAVTPPSSWIVPEGSPVAG